MEEHKKFLTDRLLSEERPVTYRLLSRALDVHVNSAKEMLYDFHLAQNKQKPNSIHATYLLLGRKLASSSQAKNGDLEMPSSMPESDTRSDYIPPTVMTIVPEDKLEGVLEQFSQVSSLHIYSLAPYPQKDMTLLSEVAQSLSEYHNKEDPLQTGKTYGTIVNPKAKRRGRSAGATQPAAATAAPKAKPTPTAKEVSQSAPSTSVKPNQPAAKAAPPPSLKKTVSGGIMQSFAKAASKPPKAKAEPKKKEDEDMTTALSDDGEAEDEDIPSKPSEKKTDGEIGKSRKERQDELRRMMEESDEEDGDNEDEEDEPVDEEMEEAPADTTEPEAEKGEKENEGPKEVISEAQNGRRRGRRRVTKKRRYLDAEGFMVTAEEQVWESFSEDEPSQPAKKPAQATPATSQESSSNKKSSAKTGQGSIMSFFQKK